MKFEILPIMTLLLYCGNNYAGTFQGPWSRQLVSESGDGTLNVQTM